MMSRHKFVALGDTVWSACPNCSPISSVEEPKLLLVLANSWHQQSLIVAFLLGR